MPRSITPASTLESLKKEAKHWLKDLRASDESARARLHQAFPQAPVEPTLRDVQHALALEHGLTGWAGLKDALEDHVLTRRSHSERATWFMEHACNDHRYMNGAASHASHHRAAARLLKDHPDIARDSLYTAIVCGEREEVERILTERPADATEVGGPKEWPPLLYLCFGRMPQEDGGAAPVIARALLDRGADPNAYITAPCRYSALAAVAGEGEEDAPPHPQAEALAQLLLERGAEPYDIQLLYNTSYHDDVRWLDLVYTHSVKLGRRSDWDEPDWPMLDFGGYGTGARFLLFGAVTRNHFKRAEWLLTHGANPNASLPPDSKQPQRSLHEEAQRQGYTEMADLLLCHGAIPGGPPAEDPFHAACFRLDRDAGRKMIERNPDLLLDPVPMTKAAEEDRADVAGFLLDLGMSPDLEDPGQGRQRPLHVAAYSDSPRVAELLIARGAEIDPKETQWGATPLGFAIYSEKARMIDLLSCVSRDVWHLVPAGRVERLRQLLDAEPELAKSARSGQTPLMGLPDGEETALEIVELFLTHGADPTLRNAKGLTAAECALKRGLNQVAERLNTADRTKKREP